ncbi:MAG: DUF1365 domain-containing protein [Alphaproteobacteria bacterium]|nr:DUF1365 domain-containing protein [Alphaproteobacteria bacterium]MBU0859757.1 DUF1365 domain-containing protein [Alphaproteobacteria bacterium]
MALEPRIFFGKVMHKRLFPRVNAFTYGIYYLTLPLLDLSSLPLPLNRVAALSFFERDHGPRDGSNLDAWAKDILATHCPAANGDIMLVTMPRVMNYVFNPVSFWLCHDQDNALRAVLCEVHNTFGQTHTYICTHEDQHIIQPTDILHAQKLFHVSPFLIREGYYKFRFHAQDDAFGVWIDYFTADDRLQLLTALTGHMHPLNRANLRRAFWRYPLVTLKATFLIHWQALKLITRGIKYIPKPLQIKEKISKADDITKM